MSADFARIFEPQEDTVDATAGPSTSTHAPPASHNAPKPAASNSSDDGPKQRPGRKGASLKSACARCRSIKVRCQPQEGGGKASQAAPDPSPSQPSQLPDPNALVDLHADPHMDSLALLAATVASSSTVHPPTAFSSGLPQPDLHSASVPRPPIFPLPNNDATFFPQSAQLPAPPTFSPLASSSQSGALSSVSPGMSTVSNDRRSSLPNLSMLDLAQAKEAALQNLNLDSAFPRPSPKQSYIAPVREPDPVDMHVCSLLEAEQLFEHYHTKMNAFIILLDRYLHTAEHVRKTSTVLFTTLLAVSAKFIRPDLYSSLWATSKQLVGRAIIDGKVSLGLIQSILLQVYWKPPEDCSAWLRVGEAIRMGYQLHLHSHRSTPLPDDDFEARLIMDKERTWIDLCAFDQTFFLQSVDEDDGFHQTCMIPHFRINVSTWLEETKRYGVVDDLEQGADFEWMKVQRLSKAIARGGSANARSLSGHVQGLLDASYQRYLDPNSPDAFPVGSRNWIRVQFWLAAASLAFSRAMFVAIGSESDVIANWVVASGAFVDAFEIVAKHGFVSYWQDTLGITLFAMGEFCVKIFPKVLPHDQRSILGWLERVYRACEHCAEGGAESTQGFIFRFFQACIRVVCSPTTTPESAAAAATAAGVASMPPPPPQPALPASDQSQSLAMVNTDSTYWESLIPGLSNDWSWLDTSLDDLMQTT
ncbi:hypothetical protein JCM10207_006547 [Rhodosporidiobolus poonsookiae]